MADLYSRLMDTYIGGTAAFVLHDNHRTHTAAAVTEMFELYGLQSLGQPTSSADLQILENFFSIIKKAIYKNNKSYDTLKDLWAGIEGTVSAMAGSRELERLYNTLALSMPSRLEQVIRAKGDMIDY